MGDLGKQPMIGSLPLAFFYRNVRLIAMTDQPFFMHFCSAACVVHFVMEMGHSVIVFRIAFGYNEYTGIPFSEYETGESE